MPSAKTLCKAVTEAQHLAFEEAIQRAGLTQGAAIETALRVFVEAQALTWPATAQHGGDRKSGLPPKTIPYCPRCGGTMIAEPESEDYECSSCGLHRERTAQGWRDYEIVNGQRIERDHRTG